MKSLSMFGVASLVVGCLATSAMAQQAAAPMAPAGMVAAAPVVINGNGCCDAGCEQRGGGWHPTFDVGFYILKPIWSSNPAAITLDSSANPPQLGIFNFDPSAQFVPRFSLGVVNCSGLGFRTNFWQFAVSGTETITGAGVTTGTGGVVAVTPTPLGIAFPFNAAVGAGTNPLITAMKLRMVVWDFEATQDFKAGQWDLQVSGGIRYAHVSQDYRATQDQGGGDVDFLTSGHNFNGAGPTASLDFARRLGNSGLSLYANGRGSLLIGRTKQAVQAGFLAAGATTPSLDGLASDSSDLVIPVGELELGVRWSRDVRRSQVFFKAGLVGQAWFGAGNSTRSGLTTANEGSAIVDISASGNSMQRNDNLYLWGLNVQAGIRY